MSTDTEDAPTGAAIKPILTAADLAARWDCSVKSVMLRVKDPGHPLRTFTLGNPGQGGRRRLTLLRFRLADVEQWEREQTQVLADPAIELPPAGLPPGHTGPKTLGKLKVAKIIRG